ncbi:MAG TPA: phage minor head protein [Ktedonobacterales bacterium]|nr:phage minor head protein [Ktedonobacterales bacterium]
MALLDDMARHRRAVLARERAASADITRAWRGVRDAVLARLDRLTAQMAAARDAEGVVRPSWLYEQQRLQTLLVQVQTQINAFAGVAQASVTETQRQAAVAGAADAHRLLQAQVPRGIDYAFARLPVGAVDALIGRTAAGTPLGDLFDGFGAEASRAVRQTLTNGVALGDSPRQIARDVADDLGISLSWALTISRTESMGAYRDASLATYRANSDVVDGWVWVADLSVNTCGACLALNGTVHEASEDFDSHLNCLCSPAPVTKSWDDILSQAGIEGTDIPETTVDVPSGSGWFDDQPASAQREILGPTRYAAYASGDLTLDDLVSWDDDPTWGRTLQVASLRQLGLARKG